MYFYLIKQFRLYQERILNYYLRMQSIFVLQGKGKKVKKSKMMKVDSRILGFSVTAAPDRLNVGDRDYVE